MKALAIVRLLGRMAWLRVRLAWVNWHLRRESAADSQSNRLSGGRPGGPNRA